MTHQTLSDYTPFLHHSINYCDGMRSHNVLCDYDGVITGTAGIADHPLSNIDCDFSTYWQADPAVADDDQYFEIELSDAVYCDSYIFNFNKPNTYTTPPYTSNPECWKAWTLKGKLNTGDAWTTLETVAANAVKFYRGTFTIGQFKYFRVESISAYDDVAQTSRIDAYLYTAGIFDSTKKYNDTFPDMRRGVNDRDSNPESSGFTGYEVYIHQMDLLIGDVYDLNGTISKLLKGEIINQYRYTNVAWSEFNENPVVINYPRSTVFARLNSLDFQANSGVCLYMCPPPDEIWYFIKSGYAFDETTANMNTPIVLKSPDNCHKLSPFYITIRSYSAYSELGARYKDTLSGEFKTNKFYITFSDPVNMESQVRLDGQEGEGRITDMDGTALTGVTNASANATVARLKIGNVWSGAKASVTFDPPVKLDGDVTTDLFEHNKSEKVKGSVFMYTLHGFKVPKGAV
jgi:hypothetical protein